MSTMLFVLGTRPEAIKLAPVIRLLRERGQSVVVVFSAQHRTLANEVLTYFDIEPEFDLDVMTDAQSPSQVAARVLEGMEAVFDAVDPSIVVVQGDTTTAMATALAAFHRRVPVAHVEAGLRSGVVDDPFPEEMNRRLIARLATLHFAPTERNRANLVAEGIDDAGILVTGNTVVDALEQILADAERAPMPPVIQEIERRGSRFVLLTTHRRENFGPGQKGIFQAINAIVEEFPDLEVVFPVHPNPDVARAVEEHLAIHDRIHRIDPVGYPSFVRMLSHAWLIMTDSGGLQEEAPALGVPTFVLRRTTERPELVESGSGRLVGVEPHAILGAVRSLADDAHEYRRLSQRRYPFGKGGATAQIAAALMDRIAQPSRG